MLGRIDELRDELNLCSNTEREREIRAELRELRSAQAGLSALKSEDRSTIPVPRLPRIERAEAAAKSLQISGRNRVTARFVQGGSPGSGGRKR
jgi:hypothetical protein